MTTTSHPEPLTLDQLAGRATITVVEAGTVLGLSKDSAYQAANRGEIPTIRIGRRLVVPVPALLRMLETAQTPA